MNGVRLKQQRLMLLHVTTVPQTLFFFQGQVGYLQKHGFEVRAVTSPGPLVRRFHESEGVTVHTIPMDRAISPAKDLIALYRLIRLFRQLRPVVVHSHTPKAGLLGTLAARVASVPAVFLSVFGLVQMTKTGSTRRLLDGTTWLSCALADRVWCDSFSMRDHIAARGLCALDKVVVLGRGSVNGIDALDKFNPGKYSREERTALRLSHGIPADAIVIAFVGRVVRDKGIHELVESWKALRERVPNLHLMVVGPLEPTDPILPEDERVLSNDERIHLTGWCNNVPIHLSASDLVVLPSYREGFGVTNLEAAAMGLPVVSTLIPGCIDSVEDGLTGTLVPPRDIGALTKALEIYVNDAGLRRRHGEAARARAIRDFNPHDIWAGLLREYTALVQAKVDNSILAEG